ncbi:hypothetical protein QBC39DRAFT_177214 [Podospora conica]|nr:hypothetical protein QBC39DRAFT_177214 [Schizothecium conicum]
MPPAPDSMPPQLRSSLTRAGARTGPTGEGPALRPDAPTRRRHTSPPPLYPTLPAGTEPILFPSRPSNPPPSHTPLSPPGPPSFNPKAAGSRNGKLRRWFLSSDPAPASTTGSRWGFPRARARAWAIFLVGVAVGLALRPAVDHVAAKVAHLTDPQQPAIVHFNGTLISATERCHDLTTMLDAPLAAPPAAPATIPDGIVKYALPIFALCKYTSSGTDDLVPHRPDLGASCREFQDAYDALIRPDEASNGWQTGGPWCKAIVESSSWGIRSLVDHLEAISKTADEMHGSDHDLDQDMPTLEARLLRGLLSDLTAEEVRVRVRNEMGIFQMMLAWTNARRSAMSTMMTNVHAITDAFAYEMSKKAFSKGVGYSIPCQEASSARRRNPEPRVPPLSGSGPRRRRGEPDGRRGHGSTAPDSPGRHPASRGGLQGRLVDGKLERASPFVLGSCRALGLQPLSARALYGRCIFRPHQVAGCPERVGEEGAGRDAYKLKGGGE